MDIQANKQVTVRFFDAIAAGDVATLDAMITDDFTWWVIPSTIFSGTNSRAEWLDIIPKLFAQAAGPFTLTLGELTAEENRVSVTAKGHLPLVTGGVYGSDYHFLITLRDGKVAGGREYADTMHIGTIFGFPDAKAGTAVPA